ncbi:MurR/RpiR family transcriptional regulator [Roseateles oligotrophus]|uniref:MurR/RpiR family transcriptional regulator n=1 Tax=Roseateles oligotrophus TaxID=1769250 RepID=A0ABT2YGW3_9BURK|nr:MurR/RpiR family transcriptional regulator [Roseateles oligotrophus]MCV2369269.1 MurR/RpiR family transcriptional regulator [Roseateles oligotrophus]
MKPYSLLSPQLAALPVLQQIAQAAPLMPATQQRMAAAVLAHPFRAATASIDDFADEASVSIASANRFAVALGFRGYAQFRAELTRAFETTLAPVERLRTGLAQSAADSAEAMARSLDEDQRNLERTRQALDPLACERAVDMILAARRINTLGFGASAYLAGLLHHELDAYCADVATLAQMGGPSHAARQIFKLGLDDLLIVVAMPRYSEDSVLLTTMARERACKILVLSDSPSSPVVGLADQVLYIHAAKQMSATSNTAALACIEALCAAVARRTPNAVERAQELARFVMPWLHIDKSGVRAGSKPAKTSS